MTLTARAYILLSRILSCSPSLFIHEHGAATTFKKVKTNFKTKLKLSLLFLTSCHLTFIN